MLRTIKRGKSRIHPHVDNAAADELMIQSIDVIPAGSCDKPVEIDREIPPSYLQRNLHSVVTGVSQEIIGMSPKIVAEKKLLRNNWD